MKDLTVCILTHNRGEMLLEAIESVLNNNYHNFRFVVSDNSCNDHTEELLKEKNLIGCFEYRKRDKEYPAVEHFNLCLSEIDTEYFVLFHDDDIILPEYIGTMYKLIKNSVYVAVGCNAFYLYGDVWSRRKMRKSKRDLVLKNGKEIATEYCNENIVPFPSYMYSKTRLVNCLFSNEFGKYSDVLWLLKILKKGPIRWSACPLMYYRLHDTQDSSRIDYANQIKLMRCFSNEGVNKTVLYKYRLSLLYMRLCDELKNTSKISLYKKRQILLLKRKSFIKYVKIKIKHFFFKRTAYRNNVIDNK